MNDVNDELPTIAFIYDREETTQTALLSERIATCRVYAARMGWQVAGQWVDRGEGAVSDRRPSWRGMDHAMPLEGEGRKLVCLVASWDRIAFDPEVMIHLRQLVSGAGGTVLAVDDEYDAGHRPLPPALREKQETPALGAPQAPQTPTRALRWRGQTIAPGVTLLPHGGVA
ncbi:hypothetical protein ACH4TX_13350 [Streptomyces sp. NPDC021098]|uniref:hypothetical protein n=1 Tax=unclassified Streptomyces TaxID=2593676 RepID=UPI003795152F